MVSPKTQSSALIGLITLIRQEVDDLVRRILIEFFGVGAFHVSNVSGKFDHSHLHAQADPQIGQIVFPAVFCRHDHSFNAAPSKAAGNDDAIEPLQLFCGVFFFNCFRIDPLDLYLGA